MHVITLNEISAFVQILIGSFETYIFFGFTLMFASAVLVLTKRLFIGGRY